MSPTRDDGSYPLIPLQLQEQQYQRMSEDSDNENHHFDSMRQKPSCPLPPQTSSFSSHNNMRQPMSKGAAAFLISSYVFDWAVIFITLGISFYLGNIDPNKRLFYLDNPDIS